MGEGPGIRSGLPPGKAVEGREVVLNPMPPDALARSVAELRVEVLLCAAVAESLLRVLEQRAGGPGLQPPVWKEV